VQGFHIFCVQVVRLLYTNSGVGLLALGSNAIQRLWKWSRNEQNPSGKVCVSFLLVICILRQSRLRCKFSCSKQATASVVPHHWQPNSGLVMTNDTADTNPEEAVPCIALSKNDSYVMSACGGKVSLFNMMTFKVMSNYFILMIFQTSRRVRACLFTLICVVCLSLNLFKLDYII
jgi:hypothetical protein